MGGGRGRRPRRGDPAAVDASEAWEATVAYARGLLDARPHGAPPAPTGAPDLLALARTASFADGTAAEDEAVTDLVMSDELRAALYAFDLVQRRARKPAGMPSPALAGEVTKVGIVGAGLMASQLALLFARRLEVPVVLTDLDQERVDKGVGYVRTEIDLLVDKGRLAEGRAAKLGGLVSGSVDSAAFAGADLVLEAVFEDMKVKKQVAEVEAVVSAQCALARSGANRPTGPRSPPGSRWAGSCASPVYP